LFRCAGCYLFYGLLISPISWLDLFAPVIILINGSYKAQIAGQQLSEPCISLTVRRNRWLYRYHYPYRSIRSGGSKIQLPQVYFAVHNKCHRFGSLRFMRYGAIIASDMHNIQNYFVYHAHFANRIPGYLIRNR